MATSPLNPWRVKIGTVALTTAQTSGTIAHELGEAPAIVLVSTSGAAEGVSASATATTLTVNKTDTQALATISFLVAG